jgi:Iron-containing redox enzyme
VLTASARLRRKIDLIAPAFVTPGQLLLEHPRARELYPQYLMISSHLALVTVPLMEAALQRARALAPEDPVAAGLADYLKRHIPEEMHGHEPGHDAFADLEALGVETVGLLSRPPPENVAAVTGTQFFWISQCHPVAILGFLEIEAYHPSPAAVERLIERTGLPRAGFRHLLLHAELDVAHAEELHRLLDSLPLEPYHEELIGVSALQTMALLTDAGMEVVAHAGASRAGAAG